MKTDKISASPSFGMALKKIPAKAYKIGGQALRDAEPQLKELAKDVDLEIIPKNGPLTKIKGLIIFATKLGEKKGQWISYSTDPKKYLLNTERYFNVNKFSKAGIVDATKIAKAELTDESSRPLSRASAALLPADSALLVKAIRKLFGK